MLSKGANLSACDKDGHDTLCVVLRRRLPQLPADVSKLFGYHNHSPRFLNREVAFAAWQRRHHMPLTATCSVVAPPSKCFAAVLILLLAWNCAASGSSCSASSSHACSSDRSHPTFSTITCSTSETPFAFGEKGTLNWDGWRCEACRVAAFTFRVQGSCSGFRVHIGFRVQGVWLPLPHP